CARSGDWAWFAYW
nr:immunoglobulin heavy chain junction region [Mus musculus]